MVLRAQVVQRLHKGGDVIGIGKLAEAREKVSSLEQVTLVDFDPIESGHR